MLRYERADLPDPFTPGCHNRLEQTGTAKQTKVALRNEGIDPDAVGSDLVYWLDPDSRTYQPFKREHWEALKAGKVKL